LKPIRGLRLSFKENCGFWVIKKRVNQVLTFYYERCHYFREVSGVFVTGKATKTFSFVAFLLRARLF